MKNKIVSVGKQAAIVALAVLTLSGVGYVFAQPTVAPGSGVGVALPVNTGADAQTKSGALTVSGTLTASGALNVGGTLSAPTICLNGDCQSSWPSGGSLASGSATNVANWTGSAQGGGSYNNCQSFTVYYSNGQTYSTYSYCGNNSPVSVSITAPGQVVSTSNEQLRCVWAWGTYSYYDATFAFSNNGNSEPYYSNAINVNTSISGNTITITGECPVNYAWSWLRPAASVSYLYQS